jgi:hypothetical protein
MGGQRITLEANGIQRDFDFQHALQLLRFEKKLKKESWKIISKEYKFVENEIVKVKPETKVKSN